MENNEIIAETTLEESTEAEKGIQENINHFYHDRDEIDERIAKLENEMDLESYVQLEGTALTVAGVILGLTSNKKWLVLPLLSSVLTIANIVVRGRNPIAIIPKLGLRKRSEIEKEKYALKALRGDFKYLLDVPNAVWTAVNK